MQNNIVSQIVQQTKAKLAVIGKRGGLDLREFQTDLLKVQRIARKPETREQRRSARLRRTSLRIKQPAVADCKVVDTRTDAARSRLYFELSNGQVVRANRAADRGISARPDGSSRVGLRRFIRKGKRKAPFKNGLIREKVAAEVLKNAARG